MIRLAILLSVPIFTLSAVISINRYTLDWNQQIGNWSTEFTHNEIRNAVVNLTINIYKPLAKLLIYVKVNLAENEHDREFRREFLRTVVDVQKAYKGAQMNFLVAAFVKNLIRFMQFEIQFPLQPVSKLFGIIKHDKNTYLKKYFRKHTGS